MSNSKLIELSYYDPSAQVRLSAYADTLVLDHDQNGSIIRAIRFGGYPEMVRAMADAIYGGATIEAAQNDTPSSSATSSTRINLFSMLVPPFLNDNAICLMLALLY